MFRDLHAKIGCDGAVIVNATVHGTDFRVVTDAIAQSPTQYRGVGSVADKITEQELSDLNKAGIRGCQRHGGVQPPGPPALKETSCQGPAPRMLARKICLSLVGRQDQVLAHRLA